MLQAALGVSIDAFDGRVDVDDPVLPPGIERLNVLNLKVGDARLDLAFRRLDHHTVVTSQNREGPVRLRQSR